MGFTRFSPRTQRLLGVVLVSIACTEGVLFDPLNWADSLDWAASHAVVKPLPLSHPLPVKKVFQHLKQSFRASSPGLTQPLMAAAVSQPESDMTPLRGLPAGNTPATTPLAPVAPQPFQAPNPPVTQTATSAPAPNPALMQQLLLMNLLGNGGLSGNSGNNSNNDPMAALMGGNNNGANTNPMNTLLLMQLMQQANPNGASASEGGAASGEGMPAMDPEMIQTMLMGQMMGNMDFSSPKDDDR